MYLVLVSFRKQYENIFWLIVLRKLKNIIVYIFGYFGGLV